MYVIAILEKFAIHHSGNQGQWLHEVTLCQTATGKVFNERLSFTYIELPGFNKTEDQLENELEKWVYAIKNLKHLKQKPATFTEPVLIQFCEAARYINLTKEEKQMISAKTKARWDNYAAMEGAKILGHRQGLEQGELRARREMALEMIAEGYLIEEIIKLTKLTKEEILELKK